MFYGFSFMLGKWTPNSNGGINTVVPFPQPWDLGPKVLTMQVMFH